MATPPLLREALRAASRTALCGGSTATSGGELPVAGNGIIGMRERAAMYGGKVRAAPLPGRGFRVTARFPLAGTAAMGTGT